MTIESSEIHKEIKRTNEIVDCALNDGGELLIVTGLKWPDYWSYCPRCGLVEEFDGRCPNCGYKF